MQNSEILSILQKFLDNADIYLNELMKEHCSFKTGGPADFFIKPKTEKQLCDILNALFKNSIPFYVMGNATNTIVTDKGFRGVIIQVYDNFSDYKVEKNTITAYAGLRLTKLANIALENGLTGLEFASGIPGTVGGAVAMNAGAYGGEIKDVVTETICLGQEGKIILIKGNEHNFGYRRSIILEKNLIVLKSIFNLKHGVKQDIKASMLELNSRRKEKQPLEMPSAGSVFKRPEGFYAGKLIEDCGLRGFTIGGAMVSDKHCGFIVNKGNATTKDILNLIEYIQKVVKNSYNVELQKEVRVIGEK